MTYISPVRAAARFARIFRDGPDGDGDPIELVADAARKAAMDTSGQQASLIVGPAGWFMKMNFLEGDHEAESIVRTALADALTKLDWSERYRELVCLDLEEFKAVVPPKSASPSPSSDTGLFNEHMTLFIGKNFIGAGACK